MRGPAILFEGVATQGGSNGEFDQIRNKLRFMPLSRIVQIARRDPISTNIGTKIFPEYEGTGEAWSLSLKTRPHEVDNGTIRADIVVGSEGCSGSFTGTGKIDGNVVSLRPIETENDEICSVTLGFSENGRKVNMKEVDCHHAHGRMCEFSGSLKRKK